jgi:hypothetical protein
MRGEDDDLHESMKKQEFFFILLDMRGRDDNGRSSSSVPPSPNPLPSLTLRPTRFFFVPLPGEKAAEFLPCVLALPSVVLALGPRFDF